LGEEFQVNTYTTSRQAYPQVAVDAVGNFVVVWQSAEQDGYEWGIFGQRYDAAGDPTDGEFRINTHTTYSQLHPAVAADAQGNFVVVWSSGAYFSSVFGQRYNASGNPIGAEFRVNAYTTDFAWRPDVAADASADAIARLGSHWARSSKSTHTRPIISSFPR
jgi:hypothetical protein